MLNEACLFANSLKAKTKGTPPLHCEWGRKMGLLHLPKRENGKIPDMLPHRRLNQIFHKTS